MTRSFRFQLAVRFAIAMALGLATASVLGYHALRVMIDRGINSTLLNMASIQAASVTSSPSGEMKFHEWELTPEEAASVRDLNRFAQVWTESGRSLLRTQYITKDLPLETAALSRAAAGHLVWAEQEFGDIPVRSLYYPLGRLGEAHARHVLQVAAPLASRDRMLLSAAAFLATMVLLGTAGTFAGGWWLARRAIDPVHAIAGEAASISPGTRRHRIRARADTREYQRLVEVLNTMLRRLDEAFEVQRQFTADASHELRSPLTALRGELELARRRERSPEEYQRVLDSALEEVDRLCRVSEDLLTLARSEAGVTEPRLRQVALDESVARLVERLRGKAEAKDVHIEVEPMARVTGLLDPDLIDRAVWNVAENAVKFTPPGGRVTVRVEGTPGEAVIEVTDTGPGIEPEELERVFDRFHRSDSARTPGGETAGTGLGLAIARSVVRLHGGSITASNREGGGCLFRICMPRRPREEGPENRTATAADFAGRQG